MNEIFSIVAVMIAAIAAVFGASYAKRKLEARGAKKQRDAQQDEADKVIESIHGTDKAIDEETAAGIAEIERRRLARHRAQAELGKRDPTPEEIERFLQESKE